MTAIAPNENRHKEEKSLLLHLAKDPNLQPRDRMEALDRFIWLKLSPEERKDFQAFRAKKPTPPAETQKEIESPSVEPVKQELPSYL